MATTFLSLNLAPPLLAALADVGYEAPTAIQARTIPALLAGRDLIGRAQTGTGKTAAFALPILQSLDVGDARVQALVLTPTRELAIQVAEAFHTYSRHLGQVRVLPVYGGQPMSQQIRRLSRAALFKAELRAAVKEDGLEPYLALVEELSEEAGLDMAEIAAAAKLARAGKPLEAAPSLEAPAVEKPGDGMVRLFIDQGRAAGVRPADVVGAIAGETGIPGQAIGAIDLHERFTFVEVPAEHVERVLAGMRRAKIRNRPVTVKLAAPPGRERAPARPKRRRARGVARNAATTTSRRSWHVDCSDLPDRESGASGQSGSGGDTWLSAKSAATSTTRPSR